MWASRHPVLMRNCPTCSDVSWPLSIHWMVCYQSVPGGVQGMRFCGHERDASSEESWHEIHAGKKCPEIWQGWQREVVAYELTRLVCSVLMDALCMRHGCSEWERL